MLLSIARHSAVLVKLPVVLAADLPELPIVVVAATLAGLPTSPEEGSSAVGLEEESVPMEAATTHLDPLGAAAVLLASWEASLVGASEVFLQDLVARC